MEKYSCPHCNRPGISAFRASIIGIAYPVTCKLCSQKAGVPIWSILTAIPLIFALVGVPRIFSDPYALSLATALLTMLTYELQQYVPLIKK